MDWLINWVGCWFRSNFYFLALHLRCGFVSIWLCHTMPQIQWHLPNIGLLPASDIGLAPYQPPQPGCFGWPESVGNRSIHASTGAGCRVYCLILCVNLHNLPQPQSPTTHRCLPHLPPICRHISSIVPHPIFCQAIDLFTVYKILQLRYARLWLPHQSSRIQWLNLSLNSSIHVICKHLTSTRSNWRSNWRSM